jgi:hypothetical protein
MFGIVKIAGLSAVLSAGLVTAFDHGRAPEAAPVVAKLQDRMPQDGRAVAERRMTVEATGSTAPARRAQVGAPKGDFVRQAAADCAGRTWPNIPHDCLTEGRTAGAASRPHDQGRGAPRRRGDFRSRAQSRPRSRPPLTGREGQDPCPFWIARRSKTFPEWIFSRRRSATPSRKPVRRTPPAAPCPAASPIGAVAGRASCPGAAACGPPRHRPVSRRPLSSRALESPRERVARRFAQPRRPRAPAVLRPAPDRLRADDGVRLDRNGPVRAVVATVRPARIAARSRLDDARRGWLIQRNDGGRGLSFHRRRSDESSRCALRSSPPVWRF